MSHRFAKTDWWLLLGLLVLAAWPRFSGLWDAGLTHFDEGGYAMSAQALARGDLPGGLYPTQHWLSPPLYFGVVGAAMAVAGVSETVPLAVSAVLGTLTVALVFVLGRQWNGRGAGAAAAVLLALSGLHVAFSRIGLTDAAFLFCFLLALWLYTLSEVRESMPLALLAGLAVGLAWNTKYHGWLAGLIAFAALLPRWLGEDRRRFWASARRLAASVAVACLVYLPWALWIMSRPGGYAAVAEEHARYLSEAARFFEHVTQHARSQQAFETWPAAVAPLLALLVAWWASKRRAAVAWMFALPLAALSLVLGSMPVAAALAIAGAIAVAQRGGYGDWMQVAMLLLFTLLTPLYFPYSRLLLPWAAIALVLAGAAMADVVARHPTRRQIRLVLASPLLALAFWASGSSVPAREHAPAAGASGFGAAAAGVSARVPANAAIYVIGEPAVVFSLRELGSSAWHVDTPQAALERHAPGEVIYVVAGCYARRTGQLARWREGHPGAAESLGRHPARVGVVRLLDDLRRGGRLSEARLAGEYDLEVFEVTVP